MPLWIMVPENYAPTLTRTMRKPNIQLSLHPPPQHQVNNSPALQFECVTELA